MKKSRAGLALILVVVTALAIGYLVGRTGEMIRLAGGGIVSPRTLIDIMESLPGMRQFQISQPALDHLLVELCMQEPMEPAAVAGLSIRLRSAIAVRDLHVDIRLVDQIETPTGKAHAFVPLREPSPEGG